MYSIVLYENELFPCISECILGEVLKENIAYESLDYELLQLSKKLKLKANLSNDIYLLIVVKTKEGLKLGVELYSEQNVYTNVVHPIVKEHSIGAISNEFSLKLEIPVFGNNCDILCDY